MGLGTGDRWELYLITRAVGPKAAQEGCPALRSSTGPDGLRTDRNTHRPHAPSPCARLAWGGRPAPLSGNKQGGTLSQHRVLAEKRLQEAPFLTQVDIISQSHGAWLTGATKTRQGKADSIVLRAQAPDLAFLITDWPGRRVDQYTFP